MSAKNGKAKHYDKDDFPVSDVRRFIEPGPVVLVSSAHGGETNIMTMGWHMIMEFEPSLIGCYIWSENHTRELVRKSRECVINVPTLDMAAKVVGIGNCSGRDTDKFARFKLTAEPAAKVVAPLISECYANFECRLYDADPAVSAHHPLSGQRRIHDLRGEYRPLPAPFQAGNALKALRRGSE